MGSWTQFPTQVIWYSKEYKWKRIKKEAMTLRLRAEGYYCGECMMVFDAFEEK